MSQHSQPLVVIVGAGPTGLTAALELSRLGIAVRIVDKATAAATTSKALAIQGRTLELLADRSGVGAELLRLGNRAAGATMHSAGKRIGGVDVTLAPGRHNYILLLPQSETEGVLATALARNGVKVEYGVTVTSVADGDDAVAVTLRSADGCEESVAADYLIGADGAHSQVRSAAGIPFDGRSLPQSYLLGDVAIDGAVPQDRLSVFTGVDGFMAVFPLGEGRFRLMLSDDAPGSDAVASLQRLQDLYDRLSPVSGTVREVLWGSKFRIQSRHVPTVRSGRILLGGDAAHVHSPAGGQGMNSGIQDMLNLSWKLAMVIKEQARPELLDTYDSDRMPVIRGLIAMTEKMTSVTNTASPVLHRLLRTFAPIALRRSKVQHKAAARLSQTSISYRNTPLARGFSGMAGISAGDRVPDWTVTATGREHRLYELLDLGVPTLVLVGDAPEAVVRTYCGWADRVSLREVAVDRDQSDLRGSDSRSAGQLPDRPAWLLVRPDGYLAAAGGVDDVGDLERWLDTWLGAPLVTTR